MSHRGLPDRPLRVREVLDLGDEPHVEAAFPIEIVGDLDQPPTEAVAIQFLLVVSSGVVAFSWEPRTAWSVVGRGETTEDVEPALAAARGA